MTQPPKKRPPRIEIQDVWPSLDCGRYPAKRTLGEALEVRATIFADGHDVLRAAVRHRAPGARKWDEIRRWSPSATTAGRGRGRAREARAAGSTRSPPGSTASPPGATSSSGRSTRARPTSPSELAEGAALLGVESLTLEEALEAEPDLPREAETTLDAPARADRRPRARRVGAWYELFPRSVRRLRRRREGPAAARRARLRRPLLPADPPDRDDAPQGPQQRARGEDGRPRQPLGDRQRPRAGTRRSPPSSARSPTSSASSRPPPGTGSSSRSTSPSSARPTTRG